jgi:hypothetical protein
MKNLALVSTTKRVTLKELSRVAEALNVQLAQHFRPEWNIEAQVIPFANSKKVPDNYWPITIRDKIAEGMWSYHSVSGNRPFVEVAYGKFWTLSASHDMMEMLVDPKLNRQVNAPSVVPGEKRTVTFPVQICDPCANPKNGYRINGVLVADFSTQDFWDHTSTREGGYSYLGALTRPFQVLPGAYLSWVDPKTGQWNTYFQTSSDEELTSSPMSLPTRKKIALIHVKGQVRFSTPILQAIYDADETQRFATQTTVEELIKKFG